MKTTILISSAVIFGNMCKVSAQCPGALGDSMCQAKVGPSSFCVPGTWLCQGLALDCGCNFTAVSGTTLKPSVAATMVTSLPTALTTLQTTIGTVLPFTSTSLRSSQVVNSATTQHTSSTTESISSVTSTPIPAISILPVSSSCGTSASRPLFIWAEWPSPSNVGDYFDKLLAFISHNCGNFSVTKLVLRVLSPSGIWAVAPSSLFYTSFLSKLPQNVELFVYPYLLDAASQAQWGTLPLEAVFKFASDWNKLGASISGVAVDMEEKVGFASELSFVAEYKMTYGIGQFGMSIGYDAIGGAASYPMVDQFFVELYDFYVNNAPTLTLVQANAQGSVDDPMGFLSVLTRDVLTPYVSKYTDPRFNFMWSVQSKSSASCLYPLAGACGTSDDFGSGWSAPAFSQFLTDLANQYPVFAGRSHGLFQFSFMPIAWT